MSCRKIPSIHLLQSKPPPCLGHSLSNAHGFYLARCYVVHAFGNSFRVCFLLPTAWCGNDPVFTCVLPHVFGAVANPVIVQ